MTMSENVKHIVVLIGHEEHHIYYIPKYLGALGFFGVYNSLSDYFRTQDIQHVYGSLTYDKMAKFMIDGREARVYDKTKENEE